MAIFKQHILFLALAFTWVSYCAGVDHCKVTAKQLPVMEAYIESNNITLLCEFSTQSCTKSSPSILWFRYLAHTHEDLCTPTCKDSVKFNVVNLSLNDKTGLQINKLTMEDSGIYYCGIAFPDSNSTTSKTTGTGTLLVVKETKTHHLEVITCMVGLSVLLFLYLIGILAISKFASKPKFNKAERRGVKESHDISGNGNREAISRAIAKEIDKKKKNRSHWPGHLTKIFKRNQPS